MSTNGKGDSPRPTNGEKYRSNYDGIDWGYAKHPLERKEFHEGQQAADFNRRLVMRTVKGEWQNCPYPWQTSQYMDWTAGYNYRSMVNDG